MLKEKDLDRLGQTRFRDGEGVTLDSLERQFADAADKFGIPVAFKRDQIQSGSLLSKTSVVCLIMYHPNHDKDYSYYAFSLNRQGTYAFVNRWLGGTSDIATAQFAKENILNMSNLDAYKKGMVVGSMVRSVVKGALFKDKSKREAEENWYVMVNDIIQDVLDAE